MYARLDAVDALQGFVHQPHRHLQLVGGVAAVGQGGAHEGLGGLFAEHHLGEGGFVQLHEIAAVVAQGDDLLAQDLHHVPGQVVGSGVCLV